MRPRGAVHLLAPQHVRRAGRQAEAAVHAVADQRGVGRVVGVEGAAGGGHAEVDGRSRLAEAARSTRTPPGLVPVLVSVIRCLPRSGPAPAGGRGRTASLTRRIRSRAGTGPQHVERGLDRGRRVDDHGAAAVAGAGGAEHVERGAGVLDRGRRRAGRRRRRRRRPSHAGRAPARAAARSTSGRPVSAKVSLSAVRGPRRAPRCPRGTSRRRRAARRRGRRRCRRAASSRRGGGRARGDALLAALEQHADPHRRRSRRPVDLDRRRARPGRGPPRPASRRRLSASATVAPTHRRGGRHGVQAEDGLDDDGEGAEGADDQLAEVVAGDVLDHPAAGLGDDAVGADHGDADQQVARGADDEPRGARRRRWRGCRRWWRPARSRRGPAAGPRRRRVLHRRRAGSRPGRRR